MRPLNSTVKEWHEAILAMQTLSKIKIDNFNELLKGMVIALFQNPLLRTVVIEGKTYIAHAAPRIAFKFDDNPLENNSSEGDLRARISNDSLMLEIECNAGEKPKDRIRESIDNRMDVLSREMNRGLGNFLGPASQEYSSFLHMTIPSYGSAFEWKRAGVFDLSEFETMKIIQRKEDDFHGVPTFDLHLTLSNSAREMRTAEKICEENLRQMPTMTGIIEKNQR